MPDGSLILKLYERHPKGCLGVPAIISFS